MSKDRNPAGQLAREIAREAGFLSERERVWLVGELRKDLDAYDPAEHQTNQLHLKMSEAVNVLQRVAEHLQLDQPARLALTMREFDAAPASVRQDWTARQVAEAIRRSWQLAKTVAFTSVKLPVAAERHSEQRKDEKRKGKETSFALSAIQDWLASNPAKKRREDYDHWVRALNRELEPGQRVFPSAESIRRRLPFGWYEVVSAVEQGQAPGSPSVEDEQQPEQWKPAKPALPKKERTALDSQARATLLRSTREANGWTMDQLAWMTSLDASNLAKIERHEIKNPSFETIVKLAQALGLSLDDFLA